MKFNNLITSFILILTFLLTTSCKNPFRWTDAREIPVSGEERVQKNLEEGRGIQFGIGKNKGGGTFDLSTGKVEYPFNFEPKKLLEITNDYLINENFLTKCDTYNSEFKNSKLNVKNLEKLSDDL